jgi:CDP-ribitol ribitolphosphotransferase
MGIITVGKNILQKGPAKTYRIYKKRKAERDYKKKRDRLENAVIEGISHESFEQKKEFFQEYLEHLKKGKVSQKYYRKQLRSIYIKKIYPYVYKEESQKPVENKIVFMDREGTHTLSWKYMHDYMQKHSDYVIKTYTLGVLDLPKEQYYENAKEYVREIATAKAVFVCASDDIMGYFQLRPETTYIQLWHGCGAFKKVGLSTIDKKFGKTPESHKEYPINKNYNYVTIASPEVSWIFEESMGIEKDSGVIVPTGISRTDVFFDKSFIDNCYKKLYEEIPQAKNKKIILYAPTFRGPVAKCVTPDVLDIEKFAEGLNDEYILLIKHHPLVRHLPDIPEKYKNTFAFDVSKNKNMDINELMTVSDICISDYSSVVFEYSLFERPMIFFTFDIEEYIDERGLYYKFDEITPGPMFKTNEEIIEYIQNIDERFDKEEVVAFKNKFMCCCDGHSSERIAALIK